ncbi:hypothetical protein [Sphingobacterium kitahiroshimense]|uniref:hypothetical protein n=1 Tax=Sphingobacterium kitahiroshimense TaxID=470446 RepID=UPI00320B2171
MMSNLTEKYMAWLQYHVICNQVKTLRGVYLTGGFSFPVKSSKRLGEYQKTRNCTIDFNRVTTAVNISIKEAIANLAASQSSGSDNLIAFAKAMAGVPSLLQNQYDHMSEEELGQHLNRIGLVSESNSSLMRSNFMDKVSFYEQALNKPESWLRVAEELPNWKKEMEKRAFNVKYHG